MKDYRQLAVWQKAHKLVLQVYQETRAFPSHERYGLTAQLRKSAYSITSNLAEGCGRFSRGDYRRFVDYAAGSSKELEYQLLLSRDLKYLDETTYVRLHAQLDEVQRMLRGLHNYLSTT